MSRVISLRSTSSSGVVWGVTEPSGAVGRTREPNQFGGAAASELGSTGRVVDAELADTDVVDVAVGSAVFAESAGAVVSEATVVVT